MNGALSIQANRQKKAEFIEALNEYGVVHTAALKIGISRVSLYDWRNTDAEFAQRWLEALKRGEDNVADQIENSMAQRAIHGLEQGVYFRDKLLETRRVYDTTAGIFLLKGLRPEKYRESFPVNIDVRTQVAVVEDRESAQRIAESMIASGYTPKQVREALARAAPELAGLLDKSSPQQYIDASAVEDD